MTITIDRINPVPGEYNEMVVSLSVDGDEVLLLCHRDHTYRLLRCDGDADRIHNWMFVCDIVEDDFL